ncbi:MAG: hypothetical protein WCG25_03170 [bacterium]
MVLVAHTGAVIGILVFVVPTGTVIATDVLFVFHQKIYQAN